MFAVVTFELELPVTDGDEVGEDEVGADDTDEEVGDEVESASEVIGDEDTGLLSEVSGSSAFVVVGRFSVSGSFGASTRWSVLFSCPLSELHPPKVKSAANISKNTSFFILTIPFAVTFLCHVSYIADCFVQINLHLYQIRRKNRQKSSVGQKYFYPISWNIGSSTGSGFSSL